MSPSILLDCLHCRTQAYTGVWFWTVMISTLLILYADFWLAPRWAVRLQNGVGSALIAALIAVGYSEAVYGVILGLSLVALALFTRVIWVRQAHWLSHLCTAVSRVILFVVVAVPGIDLVMVYFGLTDWSQTAILLLLTPIFFGSYGRSF